MKKQLMLAVCMAFMAGSVFATTVTYEKNVDGTFSKTTTNADGRITIDVPLSLAQTQANLEYEKSKNIAEKERKQAEMDAIDARNTEIDEAIVALNAE